MKCYTYKLTLIPDPRYYYFGVRNIYRKAPESDGYFGSGNGLKAFRKLYGKDCFSKEVLKIFNDRQECLQEEQMLVGNLWATDPFCINKMPGGAFDGNFDLTGKKVVTKAGEVRYINTADLQQFLDQGWNPGLPENAKQKLSGKVCIHKDDQEKLIFENELEKFIKMGWKQGRSQKALSHLCRIHITDGKSDRSLRSEEEFKYWESRGWYKGHSTVHTERSKKAQKGLVWMSKGDKLTRVQSSNIEEYTKNGWAVGYIRNRGRKKTEKELQRILETQKGRIWINNGTKCKHIWPEDKAKYLSEGWVIGRIKGQAPNTSGYVRVFKDSERKAIPVRELQNYLEQGWLRGRGW